MSRSARTARIEIVLELRQKRPTTASRSARTARIEISSVIARCNSAESRSARTERIEILSAEYLGSDDAVAVRKDRED